jgi:hypothetical protein
MLKSPMQLPSVAIVPKDVVNFDNVAFTEFFLKFSKDSSKISAF